MMYTSNSLLSSGRRFTLAALLVVLLFGTAPLAQEGVAEALLAEAKALAAKPQTAEQALPKFVEAAALFKAANDTSRYNETQLAHGLALRTLANREMQAKNKARGFQFFNKGREIFTALGKILERAYLAHDAGYYANLSGFGREAIFLYKMAGEDYHAGGDRAGWATVVRNTGLVWLAEKNYDLALAQFSLALDIRTAMGDKAGAALMHLDRGDVKYEQKKFLEAIPAYETGLKLYREANDQKGEASALYKIATVNYSTYKYNDSIVALERAMRLYEAAKDSDGETVTADLLGMAFIRVGGYVEAERFLARAAEGYTTINNPEREGWAALNMSENYQSLRRMEEAKSAIGRALAAFRKAKSALGESSALLSQANILSYENKHDEALAKIKDADKIVQTNHLTDMAYSMAQAYASHHYVTSNYGESIRQTYAALAIAERDKNLDGIVNCYITLSNLYSAIGQRERSVDLSKKALDLARQLGNVFSEAISLSNMGYETMLLGKYAEAERYYLSAISLMRTHKFAREEGYTQHNLGMLYHRRRQFDLALARYGDALPLYLKAGDRRPEAFLYDSYGELYRDLGQPQKAIESLQKAIVLSRETRYREIEAHALYNMMSVLLKQRQPRLAILYGKQAVNVYQSIRAGTKSLDKGSRKSFIESNEITYRSLANALIDEGRLAEAQQVLDLLKAEEFFEFIRRDSSEASEHAALALTESERKALEEYSRVSANLTALGASYQALQDKRNRSGGKLPDAEEAEYLKLKTQVEAAGEGMKTFFTKLAGEFSKKVEDGTVVTPQSIETLKADLRRAGSDVVLVSTYLLPERYRAIVTTGRTMVDRKVEYSSVKLTGADINRKIFEFQRALQSPSVDPRKLGKELYDIFVKPLEADLRAAGARTILWSLDGSLRYIPMAALSPDGKTYFAEKYQNVVVTLGRQANLFTKPSTDEWRAIGAGVSKQHTGFSPLPSVPDEIGSIVRDATGERGVLEGTRMLDEQFNLESFRNTVPQQTDDGKPFNVLHLATHFSLGANDQDSALLLGDGKRLSLFEIGRDEALDFKDVELLTLSACQTGVSTGEANGREVESLGMLAQKKGAKAVLATLWKVADESTALFMAEFYRIKKTNPTMNKAEAIRLAQNAMIEGRIKSSGKSTTCRADEFTTAPKHAEFKCDPNAPYSHPYFWSPFVLIGNWR